MNTRHIVLLSYYDGSGTIQVFGPYADETLANAAMAELQAWPALFGAGRWEVLPCTTAPAQYCTLDEALAGTGDGKVVSP